MTGIDKGTEYADYPPGGFVPAGLFSPIPLMPGDGRPLGHDSIDSGTVLGAVSLLSVLTLLNERDGYRYDRAAAEIKEAERIAFIHLENNHLGMYGSSSYSDVFEDGINCRYGGELDDASVDCACKLSAFAASGGKLSHPSRIRADDRTCANIRTMVRRTVAFLTGMGPVSRMGFEIPGAGGSRITKGTGNYITKDTVWDITVSSEPLPRDGVLKVLVRYIMCRHSDDPVLRSVKNIGLLNPRLGCAYIADASEIDPKTVEVVERDILGYPAGSPSDRD